MDWWNTLLRAIVERQTGQARRVGGGPRRVTRTKEGEMDELSQTDGAMQRGSCH